MEQFPQINPAVFDKSVSTIMTERKWWPGDWQKSIFGGNENEEEEDDDDKGMEISNTDFRAGIFSPKHESSIFRSSLQPGM